MNFGRLDQIHKNEFPLPPDHPLTSKVLGGKSRSDKLKVYAGCPVWSDPKFVGRIYPRGTKSKDYLHEYAKQFNVIELNATGYGTPSREEIEEWVRVVPKGFLFCPKVPRQISHSAPFAKNVAAVDEFKTSLKYFGKHLGPVLLQLPQYFSLERFEQLIPFLNSWDRKLPLHIEMRHPGWFETNTSADDLYKLLRKLKIGTVITDVTGRRDVLHRCLTTRTAFIRFDAHDLDPTDFTRIDEWAQRIKTWIDAGLEQVYFFPHTLAKYLNPELSNYFIERMDDLCGLDLKLATIAKRGR